MKNLTATFKNLLPFLANSVLSETGPASFDFIRTKPAILRELEYCLSHGNLVGIYSPLLGNGMFLVGVERIIHNEEGSALVFFPEDMSGHNLARRTMQLDEITAIVPFNNPYIAPIRLRVQRVSMAS